MSFLSLFTSNPQCPTSLSKKDVDIEHFHRDHSKGIWKAIIGQKGNTGTYPHINAGSEWVRVSERTQSVDINMGDMGYYMYFVYNSPYEPLTNPQRFTPTTQFIMGMSQPVAMPQVDPTCWEKCVKKGGASGRRPKAAAQKNTKIV